MSDTEDSDRRTETSGNEFNEALEGMNEAVAASMERNLEVQAAFLESMTDAFLGSVPEEEQIEDGIEGYMSASEVWIEAAEQAAEATADTFEGEEFDPETFRDIWLRAANESLGELTSTEAFAAANGELVGAMLERRQELDEMTQDSLAQAGFATQEDVSEVAERLVELERRQHDVERKLDRVLEALE